MDISALAVLWNNTKAHYDTQRAQLAELSAREKAIRHCESYMLAIPAPTQHDVESDINKIAANFRQAMIRDAERAFAPEGGKLVIDESELNRILGSDRYCDNFDPVKFWNVLQDRYGGAKGEETAHRQIARTLSSQFSLEHKSEVKVVGGCVVLEKHIWVDDFDKKHYKVNKMSYSCAESIQSEMLDKRERIIQQIHLATRSVAIVRQLVEQFGAAVDRDTEINGADAVDVITRLVSEAQLALKAPAVQDAIELYTIAEWQQEVAAGDTHLGFDDWQQHKVEADRILRSR